MIKRKFLRVPSSTQPQTARCSALLQCLLYGKWLSERPCRTSVVQGESRHREYREHGPLVGWTRSCWNARGLWLIQFLGQTKQRETALWNRRSWLWSCFFTACIINLQRVPNSTNAVRLVTALLPVYRWVNSTPKKKKSTKVKWNS